MASLISGIPQPAEDASDGGLPETQLRAGGLLRQLKPETAHSRGQHVLRATGEEDMAVSLDDDVPLILTLDETGGAPLAPSNSLGQEEPPSKSKMAGRAGGALCFLLELMSAL